MLKAQLEYLYMKQISIVLAALLLLCLAPMPYGYYQMVRFVAMVVFAVMAYRYYEEKKNQLAIVFGALALLFQPFIKVALGKAMWNVVDVVVAIALVVLWYRNKN
jgi:uncharacterized membrane protein YjjP (DUF1212 family)